MIPSFSSTFRKPKPIRKNDLEEAEKCLKVLLVLTGTAETNRIKAELLQQVTTGSDQQSFYPSWNQ